MAAEFHAKIKGYLDVLVRYDVDDAGDSPIVNLVGVHPNAMPDFSVVLDDEDRAELERKALEDWDEQS